MMETAYDTRFITDNGWMYSARVSEDGVWCDVAILSGKDEGREDFCTNRHKAFYKTSYQGFGSINVEYSCKTRLPVKFSYSPEFEDKNYQELSEEGLAIVQKNIELIDLIKTLDLDQMKDNIFNKFESAKKSSSKFCPA